MVFQLYKGKIASLPPEERVSLEEEARNYEEDYDSIAALKIPNLNPANPNPTLLRKTLFERHYDSKTRITDPLPKTAKIHKEKA